MNVAGKKTKSTFTATAAVAPRKVAPSKAVARAVATSEVAAGEVAPSKAVARAVTLRGVEESWTLVGSRSSDVTWRGRLLRYRSGETASVTADGPWTLAREEKRGDIIGFMHTHPMGGLRPSMRDLRTMRAWCDALGKSLLCVIATPDEIGAWRFDDWESEGVRLAHVERVNRTGIVVTERGAVNHGRKVPSRAALPRRRPAGEAGATARHAVRRGGRRVEPGG
jgi:proteasome lid subunit RPN8/RPN11